VTLPAQARLGRLRNTVHFLTATPFRIQEDQPVFTEPLKTGYAAKEGAVVKNWKKRWFVVRPDYSVEYWASEEEWKKPKAKPKGIMHLAGYTVNTVRLFFSFYSLPTPF
jgi:hypothetical protein